jgi:glycosyltransferase involved in cell wall biosynthesis
MAVSVILPTRDRSALLATALRSVLWQEDVDLEVIVVDEASTDDTPAMLAALTDDRVRVVRHQIATGVATARNDGVTLARGDWLAFIDDDDVWAPDKLVRQIQAATAVGADWAYGGAVVIDDDDRIMRVQRPMAPREIVSALPHYDAVPGGGSNVVMRRATWDDIGPFDLRVGHLDDWEMYIRLAKHGLPACVDGPLVARRLHLSNQTLDLAENIHAIRLIESIHGTKADWGRLHRWMAHSCLRSGRPQDALREFARAAVRGQARPVAGDLGAILRQRVFGPHSADQSTSSEDSWAAAASAWLRASRHGAVGTSRPPTTNSRVAPAVPRQS